MLGGSRRQANTKKGKTTGLTADCGLFRLFLSAVLFRPHST
jgi:hypothetical protein